MRFFSRTAIAIVAALLAGAADAGRFECLVEPYVEVDLSVGVVGILEEVLVDRGDVVKTGDVVARLKSDVLRARRDLVKARAEFAERPTTVRRETAGARAARFGR